jgi:hypothetical protein
MAEVPVPGTHASPWHIAEQIAEIMISGIGPAVMTRIALMTNGKHWQANEVILSVLGTSCFTNV